MATRPVGKVLATALYDPNESFEYNREHGPFGDFANDRVYKNSGEPAYDFFGIPVYAPFGIAAGPLPGARFIKAAFDKGFDIATFKSVRTSEYPCHPAPNIVPLAIDRLDPVQVNEPVMIADEYRQPLSIANSYGIPSIASKAWQADIRKAFEVVGKGQAMLVAFQGTDRGDGPEVFIEDHVQGVKLLAETGAKVIEINLSCPNEGSPQLLCFDTIRTRQIVEAVRAAVPDIKLLVKIAYFADKPQLETFVRTIGPLVDGISAINTVAARVVNQDGSQAFSGGAARSKPGVSGHAIKQAALEMVEALSVLRAANKLDYKIVGIGGVLNARDFHDMRGRGADIVLSVTGAMWNANLAAEIKASL